MMQSQKKVKNHFKIASSKQRLVGLLWGIHTHRFQKISNRYTRAKASARELGRTKHHLSENSFGCRHFLCIIVYSYSPVGNSILLVPVRHAGISPVVMVPESQTTSIIAPSLISPPLPPVYTELDYVKSKTRSQIVTNLIAKNKNLDCKVKSWMQ